jgi:FtsH-binding integral membrane protein
MTNEPQPGYIPAAYAAPADRAAFLKRVYVHLLASTAAFVVLSYALFAIGFSEAAARFISSGRSTWLLILGGFMIVSWMANSFSVVRGNPGLQYLGLALLVFANAIIFAPLLFIAATFAPGVLPMATFWTVVIFSALTVIVLVTGHDFSFLRTALVVGGLVALGTVVLALIFGWSLGVWFSGAMILFASLTILYETSKALHHYPTDMHVPAAMALFSAVALLFWYILRLLMSRR